MKGERYTDYERYLVRYEHIQSQFVRVLLEKERLLTRTLPSAIRYDKDKVQNTVDDNPLEDFVISVEEQELDVKIARLRRHLEDWRVLMDVKEGELRKSQALIDRVYVMRYLDGLSVNKICRILHYEKTRIYELLTEIAKNGKKRKKTEN